MNSDEEISLEDCDRKKIQACNFNSSGNLTLCYKTKSSKNIVRIYSIQKDIKCAICQKAYLLPKEAEVIKISSDDNIWLRYNDHIYEWNLKTGETMVITKIIKKVIDMDFF